MGVKATALGLSVLTVGVAISRGRGRPQAQEGGEMISADQVGAARRLLGWSLIKLSSYSGVSDVTIEKLEKGRLGRLVPDVEAIQRALEVGGIEFTQEQPGVRLKAAR